MRVLKPSEKKAALAIAEAVWPDADRSQLLSDLQNSIVEDMVPDGSMLKFHIRGYERPPVCGQEIFRGEDRFPVEGSVKDLDGGEIDVLLFSDRNSRVLELELVKHVGGSVLGPDWNSFKLK